MAIVFPGPPGWVNRQQQELIEYLRAENQVLKEKLGKKRICSMMTSDVGWQSKARFSGVSIGQEITVVSIFENRL